MSSLQVIEALGHLFSLMPTENSEPKPKEPFQSVFEGSFFNETKRIILSEINGNDLGVLDSQNDMDRMIHQKASTLFEILQRDIESLNWQAKRDLYREMLGHIRFFSILDPLVVNDKESFFKTKILAVKVANIVYTKVDIFTHIVTHVQNESVPEDYESIRQAKNPHLLFQSLTQFYHHCEQQHKEAKELFEKIGVKRAPNLFQFDELWGGYPVTTVFNGFNTRFILTPKLFGNFPINNNVKMTTFIPEFKLYLESLRAENVLRGKNGERPLKHLYINLMTRIEKEDNPHSKFERKLCDGLKIARENYKDVLDVISIDLMSPALSQLVPRFIRMDKDSLKVAVLDELFGHSMSFLCSPDAISREMAGQYFDLLWFSMFENPLISSVLPPDNPSGRQVFIRVFITKILAHVCTELAPHSSNISCFRTLDRGPSQLTLLYLMHFLETKGNITGEERVRLASLLFGPASFCDNRPPRMMFARGAIAGMFVLLQMYGVNELSD